MKLNRSCFVLLAWSPILLALGGCQASSKATSTPPGAPVEPRAVSAGRFAPADLRAGAFAQLPEGTVQTVTPVVGNGVEFLIYANSTDPSAANVYVMYSLDGSHWQLPADRGQVPFGNLQTAQRVGSTIYGGNLSMILAATDGKLYANNFLFASATWSGPIPLPPDGNANFSASAPTEVAFTCNGRESVMVLIPNPSTGTVDTNIYDGRSWLGWQPIAGLQPFVSTRPVAAVGRPEGVFAYVTVDANGIVYGTRYLCGSGGWSGSFTPIPGTATNLGVAAAFDDTTHTVRLVQTATDGGIYYADSADGINAFTAFTGPLGGSLRSPAVTKFNNRFQIFASTNGLIYESAFAPEVSPNDAFVGRWSADNNGLPQHLTFYPDGTGAYDYATCTRYFVHACRFTYTPLGGGRAYLNGGADCYFTLPGYVDLSDPSHLILEARPYVYFPALPFTRN